MAKSRPIKGIELGGKRIFVPGAEYGTREPNLPVGTIYTPGTMYAPATGAEQDYGSIWVVAPPDSFYRNLAGTSLSFYDLGNLNSEFSSILVSMYPGGASDDNDIQWEIPCPVDMDPVDPDITVRLHFVIPF